MPGYRTPLNLTLSVRHVSRLSRNSNKFMRRQTLHAYFLPVALNTRQDLVRVLSQTPSGTMVTDRVVVRNNAAPSAACRHAPPFAVVPTNYTGHKKNVFASEQKRANREIGFGTKVPEPFAFTMCQKVGAPTAAPC
uniref:WGS project CAFE00000000 data, contig n=1 Tax=Steinernema glaseri TaxID=37863 RepID=A0A1I7Z6V5_9BILA